MLQIWILRIMIMFASLYINQIQNNNNNYNFIIFLNTLFQVSDVMGLNFWSAFIYSFQHCLQVSQLPSPHIFCLIQQQIHNLNSFFFRLQKIIIPVMAFVTRSPKSSYFQKSAIEQTKQSVRNISEQNEPNSRIHSECDQQYKKTVGWKGLKKNKDNQDADNEGQISFDNQIFQQNQEEERKLTYDFRQIKRKKINFNSNRSTEGIQVQCRQEYYEIPGCISPKTMVKYMRNEDKNNKQPKITQTPGPGSYDPKMLPSLQGPIFHTPTPSTSSFMNKDDAQSEQKIQQNLFPIRYKSMNTSSFKKSPNLVNISNHLLMNKLFKHKTKASQEIQQPQEQYIKVSYTMPGPGAYNSPKINKNNTVLFGNTKRFVTNLPQGSNCYYQISTNNTNKQQNQNSSFASEVSRFQEIHKSYVPLQYTSYENSLFHQTKNRKIIGFDSNVPRSSSSHNIDVRSYYDIKYHRKDILSKFSQATIKREAYELNNSDAPGPGAYNVHPSWDKELGCIIFKDSTNKSQSKNIEKKDKKLGAFYLGSLPNAQLQKAKQQIKQKIIKPYRSFKQSPPKQIDKKVQKSNDKFYDVSPQWQKKSYNKLFTNEFLGATNPIKNKLL